MVKDVQGTSYMVEPEGGDVQRRVAPYSKVRPVKEVVSPLDEGLSIAFDMECVIVEETARGQPTPLVEGSLGQSNPQLQVLTEPEFGDCESVNQPLTALGRSADKGIGSMNMEPIDSVFDTVVKCPFPAQRRSLAVPVESRAPALVPRQSQRQSAGNHNNPYYFPKSACNAVSFSLDILSQVFGRHSNVHI